MSTTHLINAIFRTYKLAGKEARVRNKTKCVDGTPLAELSRDDLLAKALASTDLDPKAVERYRLAAKKTQIVDPELAAQIVATVDARETVEEAADVDLGHTDWGMEQVNATIEAAQETKRAAIVASLPTAPEPSQAPGEALPPKAPKKTRSSELRAKILAEVLAGERTSGLSPLGHDAYSLAGAVGTTSNTGRKHLEALVADGAIGYTDLRGVGRGNRRCRVYHRVGAKQ